MDILIGTHAILNKDLQFKDLGLLIIDEEQKFCHASCTRGESHMGRPRFACRAALRLRMSSLRTLRVPEGARAREADAFLEPPVWGFWALATVPIVMLARRVPLSRAGTLHRIGKRSSLLTQELGREPTLEEIAEEEGLTVLGWREVPTAPDLLGSIAHSTMPSFRQLFVSPRAGELGMALERVAYCLRKRAEKEADVYFPSLSARTLAY